METISENIDKNLMRAKQNFREANEAWMRDKEDVDSGAHKALACYLRAFSEAEFLEKRGQLNWSLPRRSRIQKAASAVLNVRNIELEISIFGMTELWQATLRSAWTRAMEAVSPCSWDGSLIEEKGND